jgi:hypothetical protein
MRENGLAPAEMLAHNPELRIVGIAEAFLFAGEHRGRYPDFFETDGTLRGAGFTATEAAALPAHLRDAAGIVVTKGEPAPVAATR